MSEKMAIVYITDEEKARLLDRNRSPKGDAQAYIWFAFANSVCGRVHLFSDELPIAAEMARNAGAEDLAQKVEKAVMEG